MSMLAPGPMASTVLAGFSSSSSSTTAVGSPALSSCLVEVYLALGQEPHLDCLVAGNPGLSSKQVVWSMEGCSCPLVCSKHKPGSVLCRTCTSRCEQSVPARRAWSLNDSSASSLSTAKHTLIAPADSCETMIKPSSSRQLYCMSATYIANCSRWHAAVQ